MTEQQRDAVMERLDRLEQEARRWKRASHGWKIVGSVSAAALVLVLLLGATKDKVIEEIRARRLMIVDKNGDVIAELTAKLEGRPILNFYSTSTLPGLGDEEVSLSGAGLRVKHKLPGWGDYEVSLGALGLVIGNPSRSIVTLGIVPPDNRPTLAMIKDRVPRFVLDVSEDEKTKLYLRDKTGKAGASLLAGSTTRLEISDEAGINRTSLVVSDEEAALILRDKTVTPGTDPKSVPFSAALLASLADGRSTLSFMKSGKVIWQAP
jgi:hypothetical protein